jgi:hypothetical protein
MCRYIIYHGNIPVEKNLSTPNSPCPCDNYSLTEGADNYPINKQSNVTSTGSGTGERGIWEWRGFGRRMRG